MVQIRDKKTLGIDTIFPVILIIVGLGLATIKTFQDGQSRTMDSTIYPQPNYVYFNKNSFNTGDDFTEETLATFMTDAMFMNSTEEKGTKYVLNPAVTIS